MAHKSTNEESATRLLGLQKDHNTKLVKGNTSVDEYEWFLNLSQKVRRQLFEGNYELRQPKNPYLRLISGGETVTISACKGGRWASLAHAHETFTAGVDPNFKNWGLDQSQPTTQKTDVEVYETYNKDADPRILFGSLSSDLKSCAFDSQEQIETFCRENKKWLRKGGYATFFLFTEEVDGEEKFFVTDVYLDSDGLEVCVEHLSESADMCFASSAHRVMVPATKNLEPKN